MADTFPDRCRGVPGCIHGGDPGYAPGRHQALSVRHLRRPAVPHRVPHPVDRQPGPARYDLRRTATVLSTRLVLGGRTGGRADRDPGLGDVQAVVHHLHRDRRRSGGCPVVEADSVRVRACGHHRHRRGHTGLQLDGAIQRHHHRAHPARAGAGVVRPAGRRAAWRLGRRHRRRSVPRLHRDLLHVAVWLHRLHRHRHGGAGGDRAAKCRSAVTGGGDRGDRGGHRGDHLAAVPDARGSQSSR